MIATVAASLVAALYHNATDDDIRGTINKQKGVNRQGREVLTAVMDANETMTDNMRRYHGVSQPLPKVSNCSVNNLTKNIPVSCDH